MVEKERCTGCGACAAVCGRQAIRMEPDAYGFLYPQIDRALCVECGRCSAACPVTCTQENPQAQAYMAYAGNEAVRRASSSGGVFSLLAQEVLARGGVVFGCAMTGDCYGAHHIGVDSAEDLERLRGSKYVQSDLEDTLRQAKAALEADRWVLFSGTPCQIAGLRAVLGNKDYEKLLCVDVICHGVPAPGVWENYVREVEREYGSKAVAVSFRDKTTGWKCYCLTMDLANGMRSSHRVTEDPYLRGFIGDLYLRSSCYRCAFKGTGYRSDITLADFWGVERLYPEEGDDRGVSAVIVHTENGRRWTESIRAETCMKPVSMADMGQSNPSYSRAAAENPFRKRVLREIMEKGTRATVEKYWGKSLVSKIRRKLIRLLG